MKQKKILITGGSGFIGYHFHQYLDESQIINFDLVEPDFDYKSTYHKGDVREPEQVDAVMSKYNIECIIHLAAEHKDFGISEAEYFRTNEYGIKVLTAAATKHKIKSFVYYSSVAVYGQNNVPSDESTPFAPNNPYGASKQAAEQILKNWIEKNINRKVLIIRPTVVYGVRNFANVYRLIRQVDSGLYVNVGKANNIKSIAFVDNLVQAMLFLMQDMKTGISTYNYADEKQMSTREIGQVISAALGKKQPMTLPYGLMYAMGIPFDVLIKITGKDLPISTNRIKKLCTETYHKADKIRAAGFKPNFDNKYGLEKMVEWYLQEKNK